MFFQEMALILICILCVDIIINIVKIFKERISIHIVTLCIPCRLKCKNRCIIITLCILSSFGRNLDSFCILNPVIKIDVFMDLWSEHIIMYSGYTNNSTFLLL